VTYRKFWAGVGGTFLAMLAFEITVMSQGVYLYSGNQPFEVAGFPLPIFLLNFLGMLGTALAISLLAEKLTGPKALWLLFIPAATQLAAYGPHLPYIAALNTTAPPAVQYAGAGLSMLIALALVDHAARFVARRFPAVAAERPEADLSLPPLAGLVEANA
jgi:hypothetical protein